MYGGSGVPDEGNDKQIAHTNDRTPDEDNMYTRASFKRENFPFFPSFTLCTAFRVDAWTEFISAKLFVLRDNTGEVLHRANIFAATS